MTWEVMIVLEKYIIAVVCNALK